MAKKKIEKTEYGNDSITALKGADRVRLRPAVIFGSDGLEGCKHSFFEIISNSIDEARDGHGNQIIVTCCRDNTVEVEDFGRGCPVDYNAAEERYNWELVYCELYAGGKYKNNDGGDYEYSLGLNGLGACATQYASEYMDVEIFRDGYKYNLHFEKGENIGGLIKEETSRKKTGTRTKWRPDLNVFTDIGIEPDFYRDTVKKQAIVNPNISFVLRIENENGRFDEEVFLYENGIAGYLSEIAGENAITSVQHWNSPERKGRDRADLPEYKVKFSLAFTFSNKVSLQEYYHNSSFLEHGGSTKNAVRNSFARQIDLYLKNNGKYLKSEKGITYEDVDSSLALVSSSFSTQASYANQTKKAIANKFIQEAMTEFLKHRIEVYFSENPDEALKICEQVIINKRARESAEKTRINVAKNLTDKIDLSNMVQKFVDCRSKDLNKREVFIVEGDSALGACKTARDSEFQAIIPVRGKILNCLKADYDKIFKNEIITDLIKVLGCGVEVMSRANRELSNFDIEKLRWNKVIIATDADYDGFHIRTMILTMLYRLTPTLIEKGFVYIAQTPLFEINTKDTAYFAYSEKEKEDILKKINGQKYKIDRSKGLGENEPEMMSLTTMNPETRRLIKVNPCGAEATSKMFDLLLGDNLQGRKDFIAENGGMYMEMADIS